jgi:hypothetical protein
MVATFSSLIAASNALNKQYYKPKSLHAHEKMEINHNEERKQNYLFNYEVYESVLKYTTQFMRNIVDGPEVARLQDLVASSFLIGGVNPWGDAVDYFKSLVTDGSVWDIKRRPEFRDLCIKIRFLNGDLGYVTPIRGDNTYLYYYDIWGNIVFGYAGVIADIWSKTLTMGARLHDYTHSPAIRKALKQAASMKPEEVFTQIDALKKAFNQTMPSSESDNNGILIGIKLAELPNKYITENVLHREIVTGKAGWIEGVTKFKSNVIKAE